MASRSWQDRWVVAQAAASRSVRSTGAAAGQSAAGLGVVVAWHLAWYREPFERQSTSYDQPSRVGPPTVVLDPDQCRDWRRAGETSLRRAALVLRAVLQVVL